MPSLTARAIAVGAGAQALGFNTDPIAFGTNALSDGTATSAYGGEAKATGTNATALGAYTTATGTNVIAIGADAQQHLIGSAAIGAGATTTREPDQVRGSAPTQRSKSPLPTLPTHACLGQWMDFQLHGNNVTVWRKQRRRWHADPLRHWRWRPLIQWCKFRQWHQSTGSIINNIFINSSTANRHSRLAANAITNTSVQTIIRTVRLLRRKSCNVSQGNGISIDANGALQANEAVVAAGDNVSVATSNDGRITTYTVSAEAGGDGRSIDINGGNNIDVINNGNSTTINWNSAGTPLDCESSGDGAECYGTGAIATGDRTTAIGAASTSLTSGSTSLGYSAKATSADSTAIGRNSNAAFERSTAIGAGASTTRTDQVVIGTDTTEVTVPNLAHDDDGKYHLVTADPDGTLQQQTFADAGFDIDITGEGALIKEGENVEVSSLEGPDENGYHGGLVTISADNVELKQATTSVSVQPPQA